MGNGYPGNWWIVMGALAMTVSCRLAGLEGPGSGRAAASRQLWQQGVAALEQGQWAHAEQLLAQAVRTYPANAEARQAYAEALWNSGHREEAIGQIQAAARLEPRSAAVRVRLAEMHLALGRTDMAMKSVQEALDLDPQFAAAWAVRSRIHRAAGRTDQALADLHRALHYAPADRRLVWELAELYRGLNQPQRALMVLENLADSYAPGDEPQAVLMALGVVQMELGRPDDAAESLAAALSRGPASPELLYYLAQAQWQAGKGAQAFANAQESLRLDPNYLPSQQFLDRMRLAQQPLGSLKR